MSRGLTAASRSGLVLFLADTGVTLRRKATTQNLPALRAFPCSLFSPWQHPVLLSFSGVLGFPLYMRQWWEVRAVLGCLCKPPCCLLLGPAPCWVHPKGQLLWQSSAPNIYLLSPFLDGIALVGGDKATAVCPFLG